MVTQRFSCNCTNTAREMKEKQRLEEERGSESETRASSGPVSLKSWPVVFCHDTPFAGLFKSGQARKTAGHKLQATDELITICTLFDFVTVGMYSNFVLSSRKRVRRKVVHDRNTFHKTVSLIYSLRELLENLGNLLIRSIVVLIFVSICTFKSVRLFL